MLKLRQLHSSWHGFHQSTLSLINEFRIHNLKYLYHQRSVIFSTNIALFIVKNIFLAVDSSAGEYTCSVCTARYKYSRNLKEHEKVHRGATTCTPCGRTLSSPANLRRHLVMIHVKNSFCLLCSRDYGAAIVEHMCSQHIPE